MDRATQVLLTKAFLNCWVIYFHVADVGKERGKSFKASNGEAEVAGSTHYGMGRIALPEHVALDADNVSEGPDLKPYKNTQGNQRDTVKFTILLETCKGICISMFPFIHLFVCFSSHLTK